MLGPMSTAVGARIRAGAGRGRRARQPRRSPSPSGRCACKRRTPATSAGRSSWPTRSAWPTTSTATKRAIPAWPRQGSALLQGIATCGRCGRRMSLRYTGPNGRLSGLLLPGRSRPRWRPALPGGARPARRRPGRAPSARGSRARPDRHGDCGARADRRGGAPAREAVGPSARTRPLRGRASPAPIRRG